MYILRFYIFFFWSLVNERRRNLWVVTPNRPNIRPPRAPQPVFEGEGEAELPPPGTEVARAANQEQGGALAANQQGVARAANQQGVARAANQQGVARAANQQGLARAANQQGVARAANQEQGGARAANREHGGAPAANHEQGGAQQQMARAAYQEEGGARAANQEEGGARPANIPLPPPLNPVVGNGGKNKLEKDFNFKCDIFNSKSIWSNLFSGS